MTVCGREPLIVRASAAGCHGRIFGRGIDPRRLLSVFRGHWVNGRTRVYQVI